MNIIPILYEDPQARAPAAFCPVCGGERYAPAGICLRCERRAHDADGTEREL